jgi:hypothetical protein
MNAAIKRAGVSAAEIDYINAHRHPTPMGDEIELARCNGWLEMPLAASPCRRPIVDRASAGCGGCG